MQTIEDLKSIGFHCNNFVQSILPSFFYDPVNRKIIETQDELEKTNQSKLEPKVLTSIMLANNLGENMEMEWFRKIYNSKLVAWIPSKQPPSIEGKQGHLLRFCILEE